MSNEKDIEMDWTERLGLIQEIAEIIYMELPLRYQDAWLKRVMEIGIWRPDEGDDCSCLSSRCEHRQEKGIANIGCEVDE
jgi:hypothetical protein